jgi:hypothetical protein
MTTLTDDTTAELAENNLVAVPKTEWNAVHERFDDLETELDDHKDHTGREFADVRGRITDAEEEIQQIDPDSGGEPPSCAREKMEQDAPQTWTPLETVVSLPEDVADRELHPTQKRARFLAKDLADYGTKVRAGIRIDATDMRRVLTAAADDGQTIHRSQTKRVMDLLDDLGREEVKVRTKRGRSFVIFKTALVDRLQDQQEYRTRNTGWYGDEAARVLQAA